MDFFLLAAKPISPQCSLEREIRTFQEGVRASFLVKRVSQSVLSCGLLHVVTVLWH